MAETERLFVLVLCFLEKTTQSVLTRRKRNAEIVNK